MYNIKKKLNLGFICLGLILVSAFSHADPLPFPWLTTNMGTTATNATMEYSNGTFYQYSLGAFVSENSEAGGFVYVPMSGSFHLSVHLQKYIDVYPTSEFLLVVRKTLDPNSAMVCLRLRMGQAQAGLAYREFPGITNLYRFWHFDYGNNQVPAYYRVERNSENQIQFSQSLDGSTWHTPNESKFDIDLGHDVYVGIMVFTGSTGLTTLTKAEYEINSISAVGDELLHTVWDLTNWSADYLNIGSGIIDLDIVKEEFFSNDVTYMYIREEGDAGMGTRLFGATNTPPPRQIYQTSLDTTDYEDGTYIVTIYRSNDHHPVFIKKEYKFYFINVPDGSFTYRGNDTVTWLNSGFNPDLESEKGKIQSFGALAIQSQVGDIITVEICTATGFCVRRLTERQMAIDDQTLVFWNGRDDYENVVRQGIYVARVTINSDTYFTRIMVSP